MIDQDNPYAPPDAPILDLALAGPRPLPSFIAGAICLGSSVPFLIMGLAVTWRLIALIRQDAFPVVIANSRNREAIVVGLLSHICALTALAAGRSFLIRKGRRGRRLLIPFAISLGCFVVFFAYVVD